MKVSRTITGSALAAVAAAQSNVTCQNGLHVIVARASGEQPGYGILGPVKDQILSQVPGSDSVAVPYPATILNPGYFESEPDGVGNMTQLIQQYGDACPNGKMALLGYSQGAQVIGDTLIGSDYPAFGTAFPNTTGIAQKYIDNIVAVVMMGDPANVAGEPILKGNSTTNGTFPRGNADQWAARGLVDRVESFCDAGDYYCAGGRESNSLNIHIGYIPEYGTQAADFVISKATNGTSTNGTSSSGGSTSSSMTSSGASPTTSSGSGTGSGSGASSTSRAPSATSTIASTGTNSAWSQKDGLSMYVAAGVFQCALTLLLFY